MPKGDYLAIDMRQVIARASEMQKVVGQENMEKIIRRSYSKIGGHLRRILPPQLQRVYYSTATTIRNAIKSEKMTGKMGCVIPIEAERNIIGSSDFPIAGGAKTAYNRQRKVAMKNRKRNAQIRARGKSRMKQRKFSISANVLKAGPSTMPSIMPAKGRSSYGDQPPFLMQSKYKRKYIAFTRKTKKRLPIIRVTGIAVPQMPINQGREQTQKEIADYIMARLEHEYEAVIKRYVKS